MLRRLLVPRAPSSAGGRWRWPRSSLLSAPFSSAASGGDGSSSGGSGSGSGSVPPPLHPHAPIHWKGHNLKPLRIKKKGIEAVQDPLYNKGTGFEHGERDRLNIRGLLPPRHLDFQTQIARVMTNLRAQDTPERKNLYLAELADRNETLFHRVLVDNIEELAPIVYTPTVGQVCLNFSHQFRRARGMYFSSADRGHFAAMMYNWPQRDVQILVVTDGSRILGLGDLGANGAGIPIGKLALYCAAGGIAPHRVLPVVLDAGTNNKALLNDPFYLGMQHPRLKGEEYFAMVDEFHDAVRNRYPHALIQFEDFSSDVAYDILNCYRKTSLCFNDDVQGTGAVTLGGILSAMRNQGKSYQDLKEERILIAGAGSAGCGVAAMLLQGFVEQGMNRERARKAFYMCDKDGLLGKARKDKLTSQQLEFARDDLPDGLSLLETAKQARPTVLLGLSACRGLFKEELVKEVAKHTARPFIFPLSNPTSVAECTAAEAYLWTEGRAIFASGSPFEPVTIHGKTFKPSQCNNMFVFPGLGLGAVVSGAAIITDKMLYASSEALAASLTDEERAEGRVFPRVRRIREVALKVAVAVAQTAINEKLARNLTPADFPFLEGIIQRKMYDPVYVPLIPVS